MGLERVKDKENKRESLSTIKLASAFVGCSNTKSNTDCMSDECFCTLATALSIDK